MMEGRQYYPSAAQVDDWCARLLSGADRVRVRGEELDLCPVRVEFGNGPNTLEARYIRFGADDGRRPFYGYWQPAMNGPAPLLVNLPGYGSSISMHPQLQDLGYNILHVSPLGYVTPEGPEKAMAMADGNWPVLPNTALGAPGGYEDWLSDCLLAIRWAQARPGVLPGRLSLYGTSQGGGGALLLASLLGPERVRCVCADLPFLMDFPGTGLTGPAYGLLRPLVDTVAPSVFWRRLGYIDTTSHARRLTMPVMLSSGGADDTCPAGTVERLFRLLPGTKQYTYLHTQVHTHSRASMYLFSCWLQMYA